MSNTASDQLDFISKAHDEVRRAEEAELAAGNAHRAARQAVRHAKERLFEAIADVRDAKRQPRIPFDDVDAKPALPPEVEAEKQKSLAVARKNHKEVYLGGLDGGPLPESLRRAAPPEAGVKTWRDMTLEAAGFTQGEDSFELDVCDSLVSAGVRTCGELADRLLAGEMFDLLPTDLEPVYAAVEMLSEDDDQPLDFEAHFASGKAAEPEIDAALRAALTSAESPDVSFNWTARVAEVREPLGATDGYLAGLISQAFEGSGTATTKAGTPYHWSGSWRGGRDCPAFWFGVSSPNGAPTLVRESLLATVRRLYSIPKAVSPTAEVREAKESVPGRTAAAKVWNVFDRRHPDAVLGNVTGAKRQRVHAAALKKFPDVMAGEVVVQPASDGASLADRTYAIPNVVADPLSIACPVCEAEPGMRCKTGKGKPKDLCLNRKLAPAPAPAPTPPVTKALGELPLAKIDGFPVNVARTLARRAIKTLGDLQRRVEGHRSAFKPEPTLADAMYGVICHDAGFEGYLATAARDAVLKHINQPAPAAPGTEPAGEEAPQSALADYPKTAAWLAKVEGGFVGAESAERIRKQVAEFREDVAIKNSHPMWGHWSEFTFELNGQLARVCAKPDWTDDGAHHVEFWHPDVSETGFFEVLIKKPKEGGLLADWCRQFAEGRVEAVRAERANAKAARSKAKKPAKSKAV